MEAIRTRRSIRKYLQVPVEWHKIGAMIEAGKAAPSSGNIQNWRFVLVTDKEKRIAIAEACLKQYWMSEAPLHIVVVGMPEPAKAHYGIRGERLYTIQNCAAAIQNIMIAATSLGLGSCWIGAFEEDMLKKAIGCTELVRPQAVLTIGYADEKPEEPRENTLEMMCYLNKWKAGCTVIKDYDIVLGNYSAKVEKVINTGKGAIDKLRQGIKKVIEK